MTMNDLYPWTAPVVALYMVISEREREWPAGTTTRVDVSEAEAVAEVVRRVLDGSISPVARRLLEDVLRQCEAP